MIEISSVTDNLRKAAVRICRRANDLPLKVRGSLQVWIVGERVVCGLSTTAEAKSANPAVVVGTYAAGARAVDIFADLGQHLARAA